MAKIIIKGNKIFTGKSNGTISGFIAIEGNKIIAVEQDVQKINNYMDVDTQLYSFEDELIMPGMCDSHLHFNAGVVYASSKFLTKIAEAKTAAECVDLVAAFHDENPKLNAIKGQGWFGEKWTDTEMPTKEMLDSVVQDKPVYLISADDHNAWLNSKALELLDIPENYEYEEEFFRNENGELTGIIGEYAYVDLIHPIAFDMEPEHMLDGTVSLIEKMTAMGLTGCCDLSGILKDMDYSVIEKLEQEGKLPIRISHTIGFGRCTEKERRARESKHGSSMFKFSSLKGYIDGVRATYTALMLEPYADKPDTDGSPATIGEYEDFEKLVIEGNAQGYGVRTHSVGDKAVRWCLDAYEKGQKQDSDKKFRNTIEHMETINPQDIPRFAQLDVVASVQPYHMILDEATPRVGIDRSKYQWPLRSLLDAGAVLSFGTDYPIVTVDPFEEIYFAVTRCDKEGKPIGTNLDERITVAEALKAYTYGSAYAECRESELGTLENGKLADITVLDKNLLAVDPIEIIGTKALLTIVDGNVVYNKTI